MNRQLVPEGGVPPAQPWPHALRSGPWRTEVDEVVGSRPRLLVGERRFAQELGPGALLLDGGESCKTPSALAALIETLIASGLTRETVLVAVGGGAITDLVGLAAATALRGVDWLAVPTTLLAAVDASLGGKTAVNLPSGKNLLGAFHQPLAAVVDPSFWESLPRAERLSACAEIFKSALLRPALLKAALACDSAEQLATLAAQAAALKLDVVTADPKEAGLRRCLNLGHTLGHALESQGAGRLRHGEAVAIGLCAVLRLGHSDADSLIGQMRRWGLPTELPGWAQADDLVERMGRDKKVGTKGLAVVVPRLGGACELWEGFEPRGLLA